MEELKIPRLSLETVTKARVDALLSPNGTTSEESPVKFNSPHTPSTPKTDLKVIKEAIPILLKEHGVPWFVNALLDKLEIAIRKKDEGEEADQLATALARELALLTQGGYIALTALSEEEPVTIIASQKRVNLDKLLLSLANLKTTAKKKWRKLKLTESSPKDWKSIQFLGNTYYVPTGELKRLCGSLSLDSPKNEMQLLPSEDEEEFNLKYDGNTHTKTLTVHCDLPSLVREWWKSLKPYQNEGLVVKWFNEVDDVLKSLRGLEPRQYMERWPDTFSLILRTWDRLDLASNPSSFPITKIDGIDWISRRIKRGLLIEKPPHALWCLAKTEKVFHEQLEKNESFLSLSRGDMGKRPFTLTTVKSLCAKYELPIKHDQLDLAKIGSFTIEMQKDQIQVFCIDLDSELVSTDETKEGNQMVQRWKELNHTKVPQNMVRLYWDPNKKTFAVEEPKEVE